MPGTQPEISIIIPVKNGNSTIDKCLNSIFSQTLIEQTEVIIIDSGSTDGTLDIIKQYPVRLYQIPPEEFNHGDTRNYGVSLAKGEFIVMTVQDAIAKDNRWLETLKSHFTDSELVAVCGQQFVPKEKGVNPFEWHRPISEPKPSFYKYDNPTEFNNLSSSQKRFICGWDDVNTMYRKPILQKIPFQRVKFGEDLLWAKELIDSGYKIGYDPNAKVAHYHHVSLDEVIIRNKIEFLQDYIHFNIVPQPKAIGMEILQNIYRMIKWKVNPKWLFYQYTKIKGFNLAVNQTLSIIKINNKSQIYNSYFK